MTRLPDLPGVLSPRQVQDTADAIVALQEPDGMILWSPGGHADPWNHVECAMGLHVAGRRDEAEAAFDWLASTQHDDGGWYSYYVVGGVKDYRRDTNVSTYVAVGIWHHWLTYRDIGYARKMFPMVENAITFALGLQEPGGEILWSYEPTGERAGYALLTGSSSIFLSLRCAIALARVLGEPRPDWELAAARLGGALQRPESGAFADKDEWAMDWYYPVLCGAIRGLDAHARIDSRWDEFVMEGFGCRCQWSHPWVTAAETAELVITLGVINRTNQARRLLTWVQYLREADGSYWTGCVHPEEVHFPAGEHTTYTAGAMLLAADLLGGLTPAAGLFRGVGLPVIAYDLATDLDRD